MGVKKNTRKKIIKLDNLGQKKLRKFMFLVFILFILLVIRIASLQFVQGSTLKEQATKNQLRSKLLTPNRGTIYDSTGKALAISAEVDTVYINPSNLKYSDKKEVSKELIAEKFSEIFGLDYEETLEKLNTKTTNFKIVEKVEQEKIDILQAWIKENKISYGISIENDIKRYYPYNNLASHLIGFTGTDSQGLIGLENSLDSILSGTAGKLVSTTDSVNSEIPNGQQTYVAVQNGNNVTLSIDINIQSIAEKYLSQAVDDYNCDFGNVVIMNPQNGDVLAMANYPDYNLNTPFTITNSKLQETYDSLSEDEKQNFYYNTLWNNKCVQNTYEPGSTFKIITAAAGLEEGIVKENNTSDFYCSGSQEVYDITINCWRYDNPHGMQSLKQALANSCNPAFIQLGQKIGAKTLYKYYDGFGLRSKTNPYFYGESNSVFFNLNNMNEANLATMSFGQRFTITPIQLVTAISAIANEGVLMEPRIVKEITNPDTGATTTIQPKKIRQVISKETADTMMDMLEYVVTDGTGKYAKVSGYSIGGKSGTSEPLSEDETSGYVASFVGLAPTVNTQVVVLVALYNPKSYSHQGGTIAGPVVSQILSEVLPYLGINSNNNSSGTNTTGFSTSTVPDVRNKTLSEARTILQNAGFKVKISSEEDYDSTITTDQVPKPGITLVNGSTIYLYTDAFNERNYVSVPSFKGLSAAQALNSAESKNLNLIIDGSGIVISQDVASRKRS